MRTARGQSGLTLVEVLVSLTLLAFVSLGIASLLAVAVRQDKLAQERSVATSLASERIGKLMSMPFQSSTHYQNYKLPEERVAAGPPQTFTADYGAIARFPDYKRVVTLHYGVPVTGMLRVETRVYWKNLQQKEKNHEMVTYLHPGMEQTP